MKHTIVINAINKIRKNHESEFGVGIALIALAVVLSFASPFFLSEKNFLNILYQISAIGILAVGQTMVIITGGIDLSIGSIFELSGWSMCFVIVNYGFWPGILVGITIALVCGAINGALIAFAKLEPFIVTLGTMSVFHGLAYIISNSKVVTNFPTIMEDLDNITVGGIPGYVLVLCAVFVIGFIFLKYTKPGRMLFAIGNNEKAAEYSGVKVKQFKLVPYIIVGVTAITAAFIQAAHLMSFAPSAGADLNMDSIAAVVIGGASLSGGKGTMIGTLIGVLLMGLLRNGLNLLGVSTYWQSVAVGAIIVLAVGVERVVRSNK